MPQTSSPFSPVTEVLEDLKAGKMVILTDDEDRENEGDLVMPAQFMTPEAITFMLTVARGYLCLSMTEADCERLELHPQASVNTSMRGTAFTVSIDLHPKYGATTGVSAKERARCIQMAIDPRYTAADFVRPGHINPLRARDGGVLVRTGQTEGSVDLCRLAGLYPAAAIIEVMRDDGEMARLPDLIELSRKHGIKICSVAQIIQHRLQRESLVRRLEPVSGTPLRTAFGEFTVIAYDSIVDPQPHMALVKGEIGALDHAGQPLQHDDAVLVRMHRRNVLGDLFFDVTSSTSGPSGAMLHEAMRQIEQAGRGAVVYLRGGGDATSAYLHERLQAHRGAGHIAKGSDTPDLADQSHAAMASQGLPKHMRDLGIGCQILRDLGIRKMNLLTNQLTDMPNLDAFGLEVAGRTGLRV